MSVLPYKTAVPETLPVLLGSGYSRLFSWKHAWYLPIIPKRVLSSKGTKRLAFLFGLTSVTCKKKNLTKHVKESPHDTPDGSELWPKTQVLSLVIFDF